MNIGDRIRARREAVGLSQEELAKALGYKDRSTIAKVETGVNDIPRSKIGEFAKALNTTSAYLMGITDDPSPHTSLLGLVAEDNDLLYGSAFLKNAKSKKEPSAMDENEQRLLSLYHELNQEGQEKIIDYADDMVRSGKYIKSDPHRMVEGKA